MRCEGIAVKMNVIVLQQEWLAAQLLLGRQMSAQACARAMLGM